MVPKKCLIVIDLQVAMFNLSRPLFNGNIILDNIKKLIQNGRNNNIPIVFIQHCGSKQSPFKKGSTGWEIHPSVSPEVKEFVIEKEHPDSFQDTELETLLNKLSIKNLVVCGLVTEGCVDSTVRRAYSLGYKIELASDCHTTTASHVLTADQIINHHNEVFKIFSEVKETKDIMFNTKQVS